tara:strand:+ start:432 stop:857 length:426 start_codon:yes stop_codon:yes gene_type:complete
VFSLTISISISFHPTHLDVSDHGSVQQAYFVTSQTPQDALGTANEANTSLLEPQRDNNKATDDHHSKAGYKPKDFAFSHLYFRAMLFLRNKDRDRGNSRKEPTVKPHDSNPERGTGQYCYIRTIPILFVVSSDQVSREAGD